MKRKDLLLITSAIGAGLVSLSTKNNSPLVSNLSFLLTGISAYLATAPRISHKTRLDDLLSKNWKKRELEKLQEEKALASARTGVPVQNQSQIEKPLKVD